MNIESTLKDVANYFKSKIIKGEFTLTECAKSTCTILIDGKYIFELWIANDPKKHFDFYSTFLFTDLTPYYFKFNTQKERLQAWEQVKPRIESYRSKEKQQRIEELQKEIESLK